MLAIRGFYALYDGVPDDGLVWGASVARVLCSDVFLPPNYGEDVVSAWCVGDKLRVAVGCCCLGTFLITGFHQAPIAPSLRASRFRRLYSVCSFLPLGIELCVYPLNDISFRSSDCHTSLHVNCRSHAAILTSSLYACMIEIQEQTATCTKQRRLHLGSSHLKCGIRFICIWHVGYFRKPLLFTTRAG